MALLQATSRSDLVLELEAARKRSEELFSILVPRSFYERPIAQRHRILFYIGHLDAFDYIQICREALGETSAEPSLDALFQAGIDPDSTHLPTDTPRDWPSLEQIGRYTRQARRAVDSALEAAPEDAISMALEHRWMHVETLAYMWHNLDYRFKVKPPASGGVTATPVENAANTWCEIPDGAAVLGKPRDDTFGWDNEYDEHAVKVPAFRIQRFNVTNGEYLQFVRAGGPIPHFWTERNGELYLRGMFEEIPLPPDWPVYVTQQQAEQYAQWIGKALPAEAQYHRAAFGTPSGRERRYPWGDDEPQHRHGNFDFKRWDPEPVYAAPDGDSAFGPRQMAGNGWEWTKTLFAPFEGFKAVPAYPGYSANFFDGQHYVMKGGSPRTASRLLRRSFRNWFRQDYPYAYGTFRCVEE